MTAQPVHPATPPRRPRPDTALAILRALPAHLRAQFAEEIGTAPEEDTAGLLARWGAIARFEETGAVHAAFDAAEKGTLASIPAEGAA